MSELAQRVEQIRRAHDQANPKDSNPAWKNCHHDMGVLFGHIAELKDERLKLQAEIGETYCELERITELWNSAAERNAKLETALQQSKESVSALERQLADALTNIKQVKAMVCGDKHPNWSDDEATYRTRGKIADVCDIATGDAPDCFSAAQPTAQQVEDAREREYLSELDFAQLFRFNEICEDSDADGHDLPKEDVKRLCELGVLRSIGFGRHEITAFGSYVIEYAFLQNPKLPLKTTAEHNSAIAAMQAGKEPKANGE